MNKILYSFQKNANETIGFAVTQYKGFDLIDTRIYCRNPQGELRPTTKGFCIRVEHFNGLKKGVEALEKALEERERKGNGEVVGFEGGE